MMETESFVLTPPAARQALWKTGLLDWKLHSTQLKIHKVVYENPADEILIFSSRQLGKSFWSVIYALEECLRKPGSIVRIVAPTIKQVADIVNDNLGPICQDAPDGLVARQKSEYRWQIGESSLRLGAMERAHVDANRGGNATLIILEEGGSVSSEDYQFAVQSVFSP